MVNYGEIFCQSDDEKGNSPLHIASEHGNLEALKNLLDHGASGGAQNQELETPMHLAAVTGMEQYNCERTPLHLACLHGHISIVHIHKDHSDWKSILEWHDAEGNTLLHLACSGGSAGIVELLINSKANAKATNKLNEMPLHIAVHCGHVSIAQFLLENRVPIECKTVEGHTPLHYAAMENNTEMITLLVKRYVPRLKIQVIKADSHSTS